MKMGDGTETTPERAEELRKQRAEAMRAIATINQRSLGRGAGDLGETLRQAHQELHRVEAEMRSLGLDLDHALKPRPLGW
jgi:hypothetical protein